ncbi:AAA family ATPase, partial [Candidatus Bathyarchaeota archaeon]|nr:AAA family ATPase [Candidatus Bathyarchaeota archaeon]
HYPVGAPLKHADGNKEADLIPEHIESDIIVDFKEVFNNCPGWKHNFADLEMRSGHGGYNNYTNASSAIIAWADRQRTKQLSSVTEVVISDDDVDSLRYNSLVERDPFLRAKSRTAKPKPAGDELALLPRRLLAYAIRDRKFVVIDIQLVKPVQEQSDIFDKLEIRPDYKNHILALVQSNFRNKDMDKEGLLGTQDLIRGKGKGVIILLHGAPGVGKTATAEAVAQKFGRPLFPITCGDLGFSPDTVEANLSVIFRLAHLWNCVLLLDEADVFLTARSPTDIKRNALVSGAYIPYSLSSYFPLSPKLNIACRAKVFLRVLEYYNGVLFLTTNRVGKLDPAITSRVHLNLHYRRLQAPEFRNVFALNIEKLEQIEQQRKDLFAQRKLYILKDEILQFAADHYRATGSGRESWNGRQIRNAFLIASSLARYEAEQQGDEDFQPQLRASHFREVETVTREFDRFRKNLKNGDDADVARRKEERDDTWEDAEDKMQREPAQGFQHGVKTYHSPGASSSVPVGYPPVQRAPSPHLTPSRSYAPGPAYSTPIPAHLSPEYGHGGSHSTPLRAPSQEHLPRPHLGEPYAENASTSSQDRAGARHNQAPVAVASSSGAREPVPFEDPAVEREYGWRS